MQIKRLVLHRSAILLTVCVLVISGCTGVPKGVKPVESFELQQYLGTWYEIARLDHPFERGLSRITATYSLNNDGGVNVLNRGYNAEDREWNEAKGRAYFVGDSDVGHLKVSFFGPFYASYVIIALDHDDYQYALVTGPDRDYLWLLARRPDIDAKVIDKLVATAKEQGYATDELIWVEHLTTEK